MVGRKRKFTVSISSFWGTLWTVSVFLVMGTAMPSFAGRMSMEFSCTGLSSDCDNNSESLPPTKPGKKKKTSFEATKVSSTSASDVDVAAGVTELSKTGLLKIAIEPTGATGRFARSVNYNRNNREAMILDEESLLVSRSFFSDSYYNLLSSAESCGSSPVTAKNMVWVGVRGRSSMSTASSGKMFANDTAYKFAGVVKVDSSTPAILDGQGAINLQDLTLDSSPYSYNLSEGATCQVNTESITAGSATVQPFFGSSGQVVWSKNMMMVMSDGSNPNIAIGGPQTDLTTTYLSGLYGNEFSGMLYYQSSLTRATYQNLLIAPNSTGTEFTIRSLAKADDLSTASSWGTFTCQNRNQPAQGFCSGVLTKDGQTSNAICAFMPVEQQDIMACAAQLPSDKSIPIFMMASIPARATLVFEKSEVWGVVGTEACSTMKVRNESGRSTTDYSLVNSAGLTLASNAFDGQAGRCSEKLNGFQECDLSYCIEVEENTTRELASVYKENSTTSGGGQTEIVVHVVPVPVISASADKESGKGPLTVTFSAYPTVGDVATWVYDFGDGSTDMVTASTMSHTFTAAGDYTVSLYGLDSYGQQSNQVQISIRVLVLDGFSCSDSSQCASNSCVDNYCDGGNVASCDAYKWFNGHYYCFKSNAAYWYQARYAAPAVESFPMGGYLATITSQEEKDMVWNLISPYTADAWIGGNDVAQEGTWQWVTGEEFSYSSWGWGQPDNCIWCGDGSGENFAHFWSGHYSNWNDTAAWGWQGAVYEYGDFADLTPNPNCDTDMDGDGLCANADWDDWNSRKTVNPVTSITYDYTNNKLYIYGNGDGSLDVLRMGYVYDQNWWRFGGYCSTYTDHIECDIYLPSGTWDLGYYTWEWSWAGYFGSVVVDRPATEIHSVSYNSKTKVITFKGQLLDQFLYLTVWNDSGYWYSWYSWDCNAIITSTEVQCTLNLTSPGQYHFYFYDNYWMSIYGDFEIFENVTGTVLHLKMDESNGSSNFVDSSPRNQTVNSQGGAVQSTAQVRFGNASGYFNGSGYLTVADNAAFKWADEDFTIEGWFYPTANSDASVLWSHRNSSSGYGGAILYADAQGQLHYVVANSDASGWQTAQVKPFWLDTPENPFVLKASFGNALFLKPWWNLINTAEAVDPPAGLTWTLNQWQHIALVRKGQALTAYLNGTGGTPITVTGEIGSSGDFAVLSGDAQGSGGQFFSGYADEFKVVRAQALYDGNFTVPPLPMNSTVVLLMHMDGTHDSTAFIDSSDYDFQFNLGGDPKLSTSVKKIGTASASFNGGSEISIDANRAFNFGAGDFTIEAWMRPSVVYDHTFLVSGGTTGGMCFGFHSSGSYFGVCRKGIGWDTQVPVAIEPNKWVHVAVSRISGVMRLFLNGVLVKTQDNGTEYDLGSGNLYIGSHGGSHHYNGYVDELRVARKGYYTASFAPPTSANVSGDEFDGNGVFDEFCYQNFVTLGAVGGGTGWCAGNQTFYIGGIPYPGLDQNGTGTSGNYYFVNAEPANGYLNGKCYDNGLDTQAVIAGRGYCTGDKIYYVGGNATPLDKTGRGTYQGQFYIKGYVANEVVTDYTVLLLHFDGANDSTVFTDSAYNNLKATRNGDVRISTADSKFGGASAYFDGSGDFLSYSSASDFAFGKEDFTTELWFKPTKCTWCWPWEMSLLTTADPTDTDGFLMHTTYQYAARYLAGRGSGQWLFDRWYWGHGTPGTWRHYAVSRKSGITKVFMNGSEIDSFEDYTNYTNVNQSIRVGGRAIGNQFFEGYIDEVRVTKGKALYTGAFTAPTAAFAPANPVCYSNGYSTTDINSSGTGVCSVNGEKYVNGGKAQGLHDGVYYVNGFKANELVRDQETVLLMHGDSTNNSTLFEDSSVYRQPITKTGSPVISTAQSKWGGSSIYFPADSGYSASNYLRASNVKFKSTKFTMELWYYPTTYSNGGGNGGYQTLFSGVEDFTYGVMMNSSGYLRMWASYGSNSWNLANGVGSLNKKVTLNAWNHVAFVRDGTVFKLYLNGENVGETNSGSSAALNSGSGFRLGVWGNGQSPLNNGYVEEVRLIDGQALYTDNFTAPTAVFGLNSTCYENGLPVSLALNAKETGYCGVYYYVEGVKMVGLNSSGTGYGLGNQVCQTFSDYTPSWLCCYHTWGEITLKLPDSVALPASVTITDLGSDDGIAVNGEVLTQWRTGTFERVFTSRTYTLSSWNGWGPTGYNAKICYTPSGCFENGVPTHTIDSSGNGTCNGVTYVGGTPQ